MGITASPSKYLLAGGAATQPSHREGIFQGFFFSCCKKWGQFAVCFPYGEPDGWRGGSWMHRLPDRQISQARQAAAGSAGRIGTSLPGVCSAPVTAEPPARPGWHRLCRQRQQLQLRSQCSLITVSMAIKGENPTKAVVCKHERLPKAPAQSQAGACTRK